MMMNVKTGQKSKEGKAATTWVAIYTRKSTDENLNAEFTSLDSQRQYCESFIRSREGEGWKPYIEEYKDPGFSGGNMDRPGLKKLLADARQGKFQVVVCYKYDRLSRNTKDFLHILELFDRSGVAFVSVTQPIDTTSSIGRLMRSILMDFAQFEREIISERTRDKMAAIVQKGRRAGGFPVLGYDIDWETKHLKVNEEERKIVQEAFETYISTKSLCQTCKFLNNKGYRLKTWTTRDGKRKKGGAKFFKTTLQYLLRNPLYIGKIRHVDKIHPGAHQAIIPEKLFEDVGKLLSANSGSRLSRVPRRERPHNFLLKGLVRCAACGAAMTPHFNGREICYYKCQKILKLDKTACPSKSANADSLEQMVIDRLSFLGQNPEAVDKVIEKSRAQSNSDIPLKRQEKANIDKQAAKVASEIRNLMSILAEEGTQTGRHRGVLDEVERLEAKRAELQDKAAAADRDIQKLEAQRIDADIVRNNLRMFRDLFKELRPEEQRRLVQLFVKEVVFDGIGGQMRLQLRPLPALNLELDQTGVLSTNVQTGCGKPTISEPG